MRRISTIRYTVATLVLVGMPLAALAVNVSIDADVTLTLPSDASSYTLKSGSGFDQLDVSSGTMSFTGIAGGSVDATITSGDRKTLSNSRNITTTCTDSSSQLVISTGPGDTTVTPSGTCGTSGGGGGTSGGSSSGGGGGGGGYASATPAPTVATVDKVSQLKQQIAAVQQQISQKLGTASSAIKSLFTRNLSVGDRNDDVKSLQQLLAQDKTIYPEGLASGLFGPATQRAVKKFQEKYGIPQVGNVGPATRAKLNDLFGASTPATPATPLAVTSGAPAARSMPSKVVNTGETSDNVTILQQLLAGDAEVYPEGTISGFYGPATVRAVRRFQLKYGVIQAANEAGNGRVGPKTLAKLSEIFGSVTAPITAPAVTTPAPSSAAVGTAIPASTDQVKSVQEQIQALQVKILQEQIKLLQEKINAVKK